VVGPGGRRLGHLPVPYSGHVVRALSTGWRVVARLMALNPPPSPPTKRAIIVVEISGRPSVEAIRWRLQEKRRTDPSGLHRGESATVAISRLKPVRRLQSNCATPRKRGTGFTRSARRSGTRYARNRCLGDKPRSDRVVSLLVRPIRQGNSQHLAHARRISCHRRWLRGGPATRGPRLHAPWLRSKGLSSKDHAAIRPRAQAAGSRVTR
jgi:hypothetical protein